MLLFSIVIRRSSRPIVGGVWSFITRCSSTGKHGTRLSPLFSASTANSLIIANEKLKFIDVRAPEAYTNGHIPEAVNIHDIFTHLYVGEADTQQSVKKLIATFENSFQEAGIDGDELVLMYENSLKTLYGASCRGYYLLKLLGHPNVSILHGGFEAWVKNGLPTSTIAPDIQHKGMFKAEWTESMWSDKKTVAKAIKDKNAILLDVRDTDEWKGTTSSPYGVDFAPRKGRLPGAVHIHWQDFMKTNKDGMTLFREPEEVREMCATKGLKPDSNVIAYCFKGARSSNTYIALKQAGFKNVTNYFGSWNEWSRDFDLEIDSTKLE